MIAYSASAQVARAYLTSHYNDIDVFVEDVSGHNVYIRLINRLLDGIGRIVTVFPAGSRTELLRLSKLDVGDSSRPTIYICDGDLDLLRGIDAPAHPKLFRLPTYCLENLLLAGAGVLQIAVEASPDTDEATLAQSLDLERRSEQARAALIGLFVIYAVAAELAGEAQTVGFPVVRLCEIPADPETLAPKLIRRRIRDVVASLRRSHSWFTIKTAQAHVRTILRTWTGDKLDLVSGKTYLLPLALGLLRKHAGLRDSPDSVRVRLATYCEPNEALRSALRKAIDKAKDIE